MARNSQAFTYDNALLLQDADAALVASAAGEVGGVARVLDLGASRVNGRAIFDVSAIDVAGGDEHYAVRIQGSNSATFASGIVQLAAYEFGDSTLTGNSADTVVGRFELPFTNEQNGTTYRYARLYILQAGATSSITILAYIVADMGS